MAKDGTCRGGARAGARRKSKALADKLAEGNPRKHELTVIEFKNMEDLKGEDMPKPSRMLSAKQTDGKKLPAADIYKKTWQWFEKRGCAVFVPQELLERYAMSAAR